MDRLLATAKAWAALLGAILTALVGTLTPDDPWFRWLTIALAIVTAVATYVVPNRQPVVVDALPGSTGTPVRVDEKDIDDTL